MLFFAVVRKLTRNMERHGHIKKSGISDDDYHSKSVDQVQIENITGYYFLENSMLSLSM